MSKIIKLLSKLASDASLENKKEIIRVINNADISEKQAELILEMDIDSLAHSINIDTDIICFLIPAEDDEPVKEEEENEETSIQSVVSG